MINILCVALGGALGAVSRYGMSMWINRFAFAATFPLATFVINMLGCFLIGLIAACLTLQNTANEQTRLLLITGFLGGFTTFSAFGIETLTLLREGHCLWAIANGLGQMIIGVLCVALGHHLGMLVTMAKP